MGVSGWYVNRFLPLSRTGRQSRPIELASICLASGGMNRTVRPQRRRFEVFGMLAWKSWP